MSQGSNPGLSTWGNAFRYDYADSVDPRVVPYNAPKGSIFRYVPADGVSPAIALQKQDEGLTTNWTLIGGGGGDPVGLPNTLAYFGPDTGDGDGDLTSNIRLTYRADNGNEQPILAMSANDNALDSGNVSGFVFGNRTVDSSIGGQSAYSIVFGVASNSGIIGGVATNSSLVFGQAVNGEIRAISAGQNTSIGSISHGRVTSSGIISTRGDGSIAGGRAANGTIETLQIGSIAHGSASGGGSITASGFGSVALGRSEGQLVASAAGSSAIGNVEADSSISATSSGAHARGQSTNFGTITATNNGATAFGYANNGQIDATESGAFAAGYCEGQISAAGRGAMAHGIAEASGTISAQADGALAFGYANTGSILANGTGSVIFAEVADTDSIADNIGTASMMVCYVTQDSVVRLTGAVTNSLVVAGADDGNAYETTSSYAIVVGKHVASQADFSITVGEGHENTSMHSAVFGSYALVQGTNNVTDPTDTILALGNGIVGNLSNAYEIQKDGKTFNKGAEVHAVADAGEGPIVLTDRSRRTQLVDTTSGAVAMTLPVGEEGLEFVIKDKVGNATANNITITPQVGDTIDGDPTFVIAADHGCVTLQFFDAVWYVTSVV